MAARGLVERPTRISKRCTTKPRRIWACGIPEHHFSSRQGQQLRHGCRSEAFTCECPTQQNHQQLRGQRQKTTWCEPHTTGVTSTCYFSRPRLHPSGYLVKGLNASHRPGQADVERDRMARSQVLRKIADNIIAKPHDT